MSKKIRFCNYSVSVVLPEDQREGPEDKGNFIKEGVGRFHCWGSNYEEFESGPGNFTVAVVEDQESGQVHLVHPEDIKFIK